MTDVFDGCLFIGSTGLFNEQFLSEKVDFSKRSMYGQADLDLLKRRVLHHDKKSLERKNKKKQVQQEELLEISKVRKKNTNSKHTTSLISKVA